MDVQVQIKGLPSAANLRRYASRRLHFALARFDHVVEAVSIRMGDINGPDRGGVDKLCRAVIRFKNSSIVVIEELGSDMARVVDRLADRAHQSVSRQVGRLVGIDCNGGRLHSAALAGG